MVEKYQEGLVKGVLSGDYFVISGKIKKGSDDAPEEKSLNLSCVAAPRTNTQTSMEEDLCGWEARNYLRKAIIGKVVKYSVDYTFGENTFVQVLVDNRNLNLELIKNGLARVSVRNNENTQKTQFFKDLKNAEAEAEKAKLGIWNLSNTERIKLLKHEEVNSKDFLEKVKNNEVNAVLDYAFNCAGFLAYIPEHSCMLKVNLRFVAIPSKETFFYKAGKAYAERLFLHRDSKIRFFGVDDKGNYIVDVYDPSRHNPQTGQAEYKNLAHSILSQGYSKMYMNTTVSSDKVDIDAAKAASETAQTQGIRAYEGYVKKPEKSIVINTSVPSSSFEGVVNFIHSGDSISIRTKERSIVRVFLSHLKAPTFAKLNTNEEDKPWAWQSKEHLRKISIGKKVFAEFDFVREMKEGRQMAFFSVILQFEDGKSLNLNTEMIEAGLADFTPVKGNDEMSKNYELYQEAHKNSKLKLKGIHSTKPPGIPNYCDLISEPPRKKKEFITRNTGLRAVPCVVEYVFSATRLKLRIDKTTCFIPFKFLGLKCVEKDKNNTKQFDELYQKGVDYVSDHYLQREGLVDIIQNDRNGNYFGSLTVNGVNIGSALIKEGHALIYNPNQSILPGSYKKDEETASNSKVGIWGIDGLSKFLKDGEGTTNSKITYTDKLDQAIKLRVTDMINFKSFFVNILPNKNLGIIEGTLADYDKGKKKGVPLEPPIRKGINCVALYTDRKHYRVKILNIQKDDMYEVEFLDFGSIDVIHKKNLFKMEESLSTIPPQVVECELASVKFSKNSQKKSLALYPDIVDLDAILPAKIVYSYTASSGKEKLGLIVYFGKLEDNSNSIHGNLLSKGFVKIDEKKVITKTMQEMKEIEKKAKTANIGMWLEMEESDNEDEGDDF